MAAEVFDREVRTGLSQLYTGEGKCRVESEVLLPDYKEPAHRIIRVDAKARVNSKNTYLQGQQVVCEVEGVATFSVLYQCERSAERGAPSSFLTQESFSYTFKVPSPKEDLDPEGILTLVELVPENISFKLLGPRKISMRSDINIHLSMKCNREFSFYSHSLPSDIQCRGKDVRMMQLVCSYQEDFTISETIALPHAYLPIGEVCDLDVGLFAQKVTPQQGGVHFLGLCDLHCSYVSAGEERFISFYQPIEVEKSIGVPRCGEEHFCQVNLIPNFLKANTDVNEDGENKNLQFEVGYTAEVFVYRNEDIRVLEDVFSVESELETKTESKQIEELAGMMDFVQTIRDRISAPVEDVLRAEGIRAAVDFKNSYVEEGKIVLEGKIMFRFLGVKEDGELVPMENAHEFKCAVTPDPILHLREEEECRIEICGGVRSLDLEAEGDSLQLRFDLYGHITLYCRHKITCLSTIQRGEKWESDEKGILFFYPEEGEELWELCKKYRVSPQAVREENGIEGETLPRVVRILL